MATIQGLQLFKVGKIPKLWRKIPRKLIELKEPIHLKLSCNEYEYKIEIEHILNQCGKPETHKRLR